MSGIRLMANHLCPRCLILKKHCHRMGMVSDMKRRRRNERVNRRNIQKKIAKARKLMFNAGKSIGSAAVKFLLDEESLVPTLVRYPS